MAFCPNCGTQVAGTFCQNCGTSMAAGANPSGSPTPGGPTPGGPTPGYASPQPLAATSAGMSENVAGALCYLATVITGIIFLLIAPYNQNKFIRFHAFQSILFCVAYIAVWILVAILAAVTHGIGILLYPIIGLGFFVLWLYLMFSAYNNKRIKLPIIGDIAEKQA
jgi:uncharacterized membrane protein